MTLQYSGPISLNDINNELIHSGTITLNDILPRDLINIPIGRISLSNAYGKGRKEPIYNITSDVTTTTEKDKVTFTINTVNVRDNKIIKWMLTSGSIANIIDFTAVSVGEII